LDAALLRRDRLERAAEDRLVVHRDAGDHGDRRVDRVGRVEPAAEPDLEHGDRHARVRDRDARDRRDLLEERQRIAARAAHRVRRRHDRALVDRLAADRDPLAQARQVRRRVRRHARVRAGERGDHRDRRALAVGAADVDDRPEPAIRRAQAIEEGPDPAEAEIDPEPARRQEAREQRFVRGHRRAAG